MAGVASPSGVPAPTPLNELGKLGQSVLRVIHSDLFGRQRAKQFPLSYVEHLGDGVAYSKMSLSEDLLGVPVDESVFTSVAGHPDLYAHLEPSTAITPPWEPDAVWVLASLYEKEGRSPLCPRGILSNAADRLADRFGMTAQTAAEPEFYLFLEQDRRSSREPYSTDGVSYTVDRLTDPAGSVGRIHRMLIECGIGVTVMNREFSPGQFEVNLHHDDIRRAADQAFLLKAAIKELAIAEGLRANFMAKPLTGHEGSGLHVHASFWNDDVNVFNGPDGGLSEHALSAIAGVQLHAPAIMAFGAPTTNSYKRLRGEGLSPRSSNFALDNRHSFVRIPPERGRATRFELRAGDASASPHLLMAALLYAAMDGMEKKLQPSAEGVALPRSLEQSLTALEGDDVFVQELGTEFIDIYTAIKRSEVEAAGRSVTDWEWETYHSHA